MHTKALPFTPPSLPRIPQRLIHVLHPLHLIRRKARVTTFAEHQHPHSHLSDRIHSPRIIAVVHEVRNRIHPWSARTAVFARRTPARRGALLWRVGDVVAGIGGRARPVLEGVQQAEPVPHLVHGRLALTVAVHVAVRHAAGEDVAAVAAVVGRGEFDHLAGAAGPIGDVGGQGTVAEQLGVGGRRHGREVGLEVDVQRGVVALAEGGLHGGVGGVGRPRVVDRVGDVAEREGEGRAGVCGFEGVELAGHHGRRDGVLGVGRGHDVEVGVDRVFGHGAAGAEAGGGDGIGEIAVRSNEMGPRGAGATRPGWNLAIATFSKRMEVFDRRKHTRCMGQMRNRESRMGDRRANE